MPKSLGATGNQANRRRPAWATLALSVGFGLAAVPAVAAPPPLDVASTESNLTPGGAGAGPFGFVEGLGKSDLLLGDMWGLRSGLSRFGITFALSETSEVLGNVTGGVKTGFAYDGLTQASLQLDTERAFGWHGGMFNISGLQIHGRDLSANNLLTLQTASGIEANRAWRLWELWYQQQILDQKRLDVRVGQMSLDNEFIISQEALLFVNTAFGWPIVPSVDLPGGGPAYPLSALGVRARGQATDTLTWLLAVLNGNPAPNRYEDPQVANPAGVSFPLNGGALVIGELQFSYPALGAIVAPDQGEPLAGTYRIGFWYNSEEFDDLQFDNTGLSLANPDSLGTPQRHHGNYSIYSVMDQTVWRSSDSDQTVKFFARAMGTPQGDRNLVVFGLNAGFTLYAPFASRGDDVAGIGMGYARVSGSASALDRTTGFYTGTFQRVRSGETYIEAMYRYQLIPSVILQPDLQYVFNPGAGIVNPDIPTQSVKNEFVLGLRVSVTF
jgi:porin